MAIQGDEVVQRVDISLKWLLLYSVKVFSIFFFFSEKLK